MRGHYDENPPRSMLVIVVGQRMRVVPGPGHKTQRGF